MGKSSSGASSQPIVIGYFYSLSMHMVLCHGPVDSINKIKAGDSTIWSGSVSNSQIISINQPNIFGGRLKEGGVVGSVGIEMGDPSQGVNAMLSQHTGGPTQTPAYRGVVGLVWYNVEYSANSARPKPWRVQATRLPKVLFSNATDVNINGHANAAYIIAESLTNEEWGLGYTESDLDQSAFLASAATLKTENFGLSLLWDRSTPLEDFITVILQHVNGSLYVDPATGLFTLKLIRADYNYVTLPVFDERNIIEVDDYARIAVSGLINQLTVKWIDADTNEWLSLTEHNPAVKELQGSIVSAVREYPALTDSVKAREVAIRDMSILSQPLAKVTLVMSRSASGLRIGDVFKWDWNDYGIIGMPLRVLSVNFGLLENGSITVECVEDVFGADLVKYGAPTGSEWVDPNPIPQQAVSAITFNASYYDVLTESNNHNIPVSADKDFGYMAVCAARPDPVITTYELWSNFYQFSTVDNTDYKFRGGNLFTPYATLGQKLLPEYQSTFAITFMSGVEDIRLNSLLMCGSEVMQLISIAADLTTITVHRGVLDTTPYIINAGAEIWFYEDYRAYAPVEWPDTQEVSNKVLSMTSRGVFDLATANSFQGIAHPRWYFPYPPAGLKVNGIAYPTVALTGDLTITWQPRNRLVQDNQIIYQTDTGIAPEAGVTYTLRVLSPSGAVLHTVENLEVPAYTYTAAQATTDAVGDLFHIAVVSVREGLSSHVAHFTSVSRTGAAVPELPANLDVMFPSHPSFGTYTPASLDFVTKVRVTNLLAKNHYETWSSTQFSGRDINLKWENDSGTVFANTTAYSPTTNWFKDYVVTVKDSANTVLRTEYVSSPSYTYTFAKNLADIGGPRRTVTIEIRLRSPLLGLSAPTVVTLNNPAIPVIAWTLTPSLETTFVHIEATTAPDVKDYRVYRGNTVNFAKDVTSLIYEGPSPQASFTANSSVKYWYAVSIIDTFGATGELITTEQATTSFAVDPAALTYDGLVFKANNPTTNRLTWSAATISRDGVVTWSITAETVGRLWTSGTLYVYYVPGDTVLKTNTSLSGLLSTGGKVVATYRGGTDVTADEGRAFISGDQLLAGTVGAAQLVANTAVITNSLQVKNGIIKNAHIQDLDAQKITATSLSVISADAGTLTAGILQSPDGGFKIDLANKTIVIQ